MAHDFLMHRLQAMSVIFRRRRRRRRDLGRVEAKLDVTPREVHLGRRLEFGEDVDDETQDVECDVLGQRRAAEQLEQPIQQRHEEPDQSRYVDGVKGFDELGGRRIGTAVVRPAVLEEGVKVRIGAEDKEGQGGIDSVHSGLKLYEIDAFNS